MPVCRSGAAMGVVLCSSASSREKTLIDDDVSRNDGSWTQVLRAHRYGTSAQKKTLRGGFFFGGRRIQQSVSAFRRNELENSGAGGAGAARPRHLAIGLKTRLKDNGHRRAYRRGTTDNGNRAVLRDATAGHLSCRGDGEALTRACERVVALRRFSDRRLET